MRRKSGTFLRDLDQFRRTKLASNWATGLGTNIRDIKCTKRSAGGPLPKNAKRREQNQLFDPPRRKHTTLSERRRKNVTDRRIFGSDITPGENHFVLITVTVPLGTLNTEAM